MAVCIECFKPIKDQDHKDYLEQSQQKALCEKCSKYSDLKDPEMLKNSLTCCVCYHNKVDTVFPKCGHIPICNNCHQQMPKHNLNKCPICNSISSNPAPFKAHFT